MIVIDIVTWAFAAMLFAVPVMWLYAVAWMIYSIVREETE